MNQDLIKKIENVLQKLIHRHYQNKSINIFDEFVKFCHEHYDGPAHSLAEIKMKKNTKLKGDIFEHFALKYFQHCYQSKAIPMGFANVWLLKDVPDSILTQLKLKRGDFGIDLVAETNSPTNPRYYAVQAKYRKKGYKATHGIPWQQLSTFYGLINRTGPYEKHIAFTNANYVRHIGRKNQKDQSICYGTLSKIPVDDWVKMANMQGQKVGSHSSQPAPIIPLTLPMVPAQTVEENSDEPSKKKITIIRKKILETDIEALRAKRLEFFAKTSLSNIKEI